jgi:hypothetical protein
VAGIVNAHTIGKVLHYPITYLVLIIVSLMDIGLTCVILTRGGQELNPIADKVIVCGGMIALPAFKFLMLLGLVYLCEFMAGRRPKAGRQITRFAALMWSLPPAYAVWQLCL